MILTYARNYFFSAVFTGIMAVLYLGWVAPVAAQGGISITVAPTLVELNMQPGEMWRSSIKVVNTNPFPLTVATTPAHFAPAGERGQGSVVPVVEVPDDETLLVNWLTVESPEVTIQPGESIQVPFVIATPNDAAPGSHFAALQVSTVPPSQAQQVGLNTSQVISSLLFVRIAGDIEEVATIRSFTATNSFQTEPRTALVLRFENTGNVHVRPVGEILIRNVWGTERGRIPVNYNTSFGNALPGTIREYRFAWSKEASLLDIGYYTAEVSLAYGVEARQFASAITGFWVIPIKPLLVLGAVIFAIIGFIILVSRWYISRLLQQAGVSSLRSLHQTQSAARTPSPTSDLNLSSVTPKSKKTLYQSKATSSLVYCRQWLGARLQTLIELWELMSPTARRTAALVVIGLILCVVGAVLLLRSTYNPSYQATVGDAEQAVTYNAEEIAFFQQPGMNPGLLSHDAQYEVHIVNTSKNVGAAGRVAALLTPAYPVTQLRADATDERPRTVILFPVELQAEAVALSEVLDGALLSAAELPTPHIQVYLGADATW